MDAFVDDWMHRCKDARQNLRLFTFTFKFTFLPYSCQFSQHLNSSNTSYADMYACEQTYVTCEIGRTW